MSTVEATYCSQGDMQFVLPSIDEYDTKRVLPTNWVESGTSNLYELHNSGYVSILFKDGQDLGSENGSEPSSNNQWRYIEADDNLEFFLSLKLTYLKPNKHSLHIQTSKLSQLLLTSLIFQIKVCYRAFKYFCCQSYCFR